MIKAVTPGRRGRAVTSGQSTSAARPAFSCAIAIVIFAIALIGVHAASATTRSIRSRAGTNDPRTTGLAVTRAKCAPNVANDLAHVGGAIQLLTVQSMSYSSTNAVLVAWRRDGHCWMRRFGPWLARIGYAGFSDHKTEGDGTTPTGEYRIGDVMYGNATNPGVHYAFHHIACGDWWDEDPASPLYNRFVHVTCGTPPPFGGDSEALWQETLAYPIFAVVEYNTSPVVPGRGSAIFIHADVGGPTAGCVSLPLRELDELLRWLEPIDRPIVAMGPRSEIERF